MSTDSPQHGSPHHEATRSAARLDADITIRHAAATDLPDIVAIYNESIPGRLATSDLEPVTVDSRRAWFDAHTPVRRPIWVAVDHHRIVGWLSLRDFYGRPAYHATVEVACYIASSHHRRGIASALLTHAIAHAPALGIRTLLAFVFAHNGPSNRLLDRFGFVPWGHLPRVAELDHIERDLIIRGLRLDTKPVKAPPPLPSNPVRP
jgi:phosphinothricin acetyltransferase